jgi:transposase-like protein
MKDDYFTVNELARHFGVNPKTIYRRLWAKGIPAYKVMYFGIYFRSY